MIFQKYPIHVVVWKRYGNVIKPNLGERGRIIKKKSNNVGGPTERIILHLKKARIDIKAPEIQSYQEIGNKRWLHLYQVDRLTFYPIHFSNEKVTIKAKQIVTGEDGNPLKEENGKYKMKEVEVPLFYGNYAYNTDKKKIIELPSMMTYENYNKEQWMGGEMEAAERLYRGKGFWDKYGHIIVYLLSVFAIIMVLSVVLQNIGQLFGQNVEAAKEVALGLKENAELLRQVLGQAHQVAPLIAPN